ncbi:MAG: DUF4438 domain-containing protein [Planctomycetes bacterium]|nr:DUF4438 domain-containing protein [Planctomycetota bacterium]
MENNQEQLVELSVVGEVSHPPIWGYRVGADGQVRFLPGIGGVTYNVKVGMSAVHWKADHVEPGVSCQNFAKQFDGTAAGFGVLCQIGNKAIVISGDAKGGEGTVTGKHGGGGSSMEHVMIDFDDATLEQLVPGDRILVRAYGLGLEFPGFPEIKAMNVDPRILDRLNLRREKKRLVLPVHLAIPAAAMGAGLGSQHSYSGDYDIQLFDPQTVAEYHLDKLRLGDLVAITDADARFGRYYRQGHVIVGIVVHCCSTVAGHGPGVTPILTGSAKELGFEFSERANIAFALGIGSARKKHSARLEVRAGRNGASHHPALERSASLSTYPDGHCAW